MEFKIITDIENPVFNRREIQGEMHSEAAPKREEVRKIISEKASAPEEAIKIKTIKGKFGSQVFLIVANIYKTKEEMDKVELKKKKDLEAEKKSEEAKKVAEQPAETSEPEKENSEEKPAEENTEEKTEEKTEVKEEEVKE